MTLDNFPTTRPSFTANFARSQQMPPQMTFSRASQATSPAVPSPGTVTGPNGVSLSDYNTPRFQWKDGKCQGLLFEKSRTNLVTNSENMSGTGWTGATTISADATIAPDGTSTGDLVYPSSSGFYRARYLPITTSGVVTLSAYVKTSGWQYINLGMIASGAAVKFDLTNNTFNIVDTNYSNADIQAVGNGWFRIQATCDVATVSGDSFAIAFTDDFGSGMYATASGTSGIYIWGAQLETGSFPTSYIPTSGSTATRAEDVCAINQANLNSFGYSDYVGTFVAELNVTAADSYARILASGNQGQWEFNTFANKAIAFQWVNPLKPGVKVEQVPIGDLFKISASYQIGEKMLATIDGKTYVSSSAKADSIRNKSSLHLMRGSGYYTTGIYSRLSYYPTYVSGEALEALTQ